MMDAGNETGSLRTNRLSSRVVGPEPVTQPHQENEQAHAFLNAVPIIGLAFIRPPLSHHEMGQL